MTLVIPGPSASEEPGIHIRWTLGIGAEYDPRDLGLSDSGLALCAPRNDN